MAKRLSILPAAQIEFDELAKNIRIGDRFELEAFNGRSAEENIEMTKNNAIVAYGVRDEDNRLVCMYGVGIVPRDSSIGLIWFLATNLIDKHKLIVARHSKSELARISRNFSLVYNYVVSRNVTTINWLGRMGFKEVRRLENWRSTGVDFILLAYRTGEYPQ
jgi:hypothetical protein